jgi:uncharacterized coiled-coil DUF342 family protein
METNKRVRIDNGISFAFDKPQIPTVFTSAAEINRLHYETMAKLTDNTFILFIEENLDDSIISKEFGQHILKSQYYSRTNSLLIQLKNFSGSQLQGWQNRLLLFPLKGSGANTIYKKIYLNNIPCSKLVRKLKTECNWNIFTIRIIKDEIGLCMILQLPEATICPPSLEIDNNRINIMEHIEFRKMEKLEHAIIIYNLPYTLLEIKEKLEEKGIKVKEMKELKSQFQERMCILELHQKEKYEELIKSKFITIGGKPYKLREYVVSYKKRIQSTIERVNQGEIVPGSNTILDMLNYHQKQTKEIFEIKKELKTQKELWDQTNKKVNTVEKVVVKLESKVEEVGENFENLQHILKETEKGLNLIKGFLNNKRDRENENGNAKQTSKRNNNNNSGNQENIPFFSPPRSRNYG